MIWTPWQEKESGAFKTSDERIKWTTAHHNLYSNNSMYKMVYDQLDRSLETYSVKQPNIDGGFWYRGSYSPETHTVQPYLFVPKKDSEGTMFEEVFHAGQDDYNNTNKTSQTLIETEVEAKFAKVASGVGEDEFNISNNCPNIVAAIKNGEQVTSRTLFKDAKGILSVYKSVNEVYRFSGKDASFNANTFLDYLNFLNQKKKKDEKK